METVAEEIYSAGSHYHSHDHHCLLLVLGQETTSGEGKKVGSL